MSVAKLFSQDEKENPLLDIYPRTVTTTVVNISPKPAVVKNWNPQTTDSLSVNASEFSVRITFITNGLTVGLCSSKLTINCPYVHSDSLVGLHSSQFSSIPPAYDGSTQCGWPQTIVSGIREGSFDMQVISNGYANINVNDSFTLFVFTS